MLVACACSLDTEGGLPASHGAAATSGSGGVVDASAGTGGVGGNAGASGVGGGGTSADASAEASGGSAGNAGEAGTPPLPTCEELYTGVTGVLQVCGEDGQGCQLSADTDPDDGDPGQHCTAICAAAGGECKGSFDNGASVCEADPTDERPCTDDTLSEGVCVCSRGCGEGPPCRSGSCVQGQCV